MTYCTKCGNMIGIGDNYCSGCGRMALAGTGLGAMPRTQLTAYKSESRHECKHCGGTGQVPLPHSGGAGMLASVLTVGFAAMLQATCPKCDGEGYVTWRQGD